MSLWYKQGVIYQIAPISFYDSDNDGKGDIRGITKKLNYLTFLGIDAIWLCPIYPSPMKDFGYDVADYYNINPIFGKMKDFDELIEQAHKRKIKVILDFVPNHCSDQHPWFIDARVSKNSSKRNWFIWQDPKPNGNPPNNWLSAFGGSAWTLDKKTNQYYLHSFLPEQPELNWRDPKVKKEFLNIMKFWLEKGVDGFRIDVVDWLFKDKFFRDDPINKKYKGNDPSTYESLIHKYSRFGPEIHKILKKMRRLTETYPERVLIGEVCNQRLNKLVTFYGKANDELHLPFNFHFLINNFTSGFLKRFIKKYLQKMPVDATLNTVLGSHDSKRLLSRLGEKRARLAALFQLTFKGTPFIYSGDEIGIENLRLSLDQYIDHTAHREFQRLKKPPKTNIALGRDPGRSPMQWNDDDDTGFSKATPWLPISDNHKTHNVSSETKDKYSLLNLYRKLIHLRKDAKALNQGDCVLLNMLPTKVVGYERSCINQKYQIFLNFSNSKIPLDIKGSVVFSTENLSDVLINRNSINPKEGIISKL